MTLGLKLNIDAMKRTKQTPSFVQVLITFEDALAEIQKLQAENALLKAYAAAKDAELEDWRGL